MNSIGTAIDEHAIVALVTAVADWPAGTKGTIVGEGVDHKFIEITNSHGEWVGDVSARPEQLRLVRESVGPADIGELDRVALLSTVDGWNPGTTGIVIEVAPTHRVIEIFGYLDESLDFIEVPTGGAAADAQMPAARSRLCTQQGDRGHRGAPGLHANRRT